MFGLDGQLRDRVIEPRHDEQGIVPKPPSASWSVRNAARQGPSGNCQEPCRTRQRQDAPKARLSPRWRHVLKEPKQLRVIGAVVAVATRKASRPDAWRAVQGCDFQTGIIREGEAPNGPSDRHGFLHGILGKRPPTLADHRRMRDARQRPPAHARNCQQAFELTKLVGVARGDHDVNHHPRLELAHAAAAKRLALKDDKLLNGAAG